MRFNQTLENCLKVSVGNDTYGLTKNDKISITDITFIRNSNTGGYVLSLWKIYCNDKNGGGKISKFIEAKKSSSSTCHSGATSLLPIGNIFMFIETSSNLHGNIVYVSFERTDFIQNTNITFYYNRFSILTKDFLKSMGRFRIHLLLEDNTWSTRYNIPEIDRYSETSTDCSLKSLCFTVENYGIKLIYDEIDTTHADMCFSIFTIIHALY